jgi:hypothetical protein
VLNGIGLLVNFTEVELFLKATLTVVVTGYTLQKWYLMNKNKNKPKDKE